MLIPLTGFYKPSAIKKEEEVGLVRQTKKENHTLFKKKSDPKTLKINEPLNSDCNDDCLYKTNTFEK